ncbi:organic cation transporter protein-like isoform X2 [Lepisosteus oculatus]|uniref:organic cation transporter protein-like isoform X2 n=1 Tax=Lepisosteus oculatus TaxID=7918 RepID=UPI0037249FCB
MELFTEYLGASLEAHAKEQVQADEISLFPGITNMSEERLWNITVPQDSSRLGKYSWSECHQYDIAQVNLSFSPEEWADPASNNYSLVPCQSWYYDKSVYFSTVATEWDLVCERKWMRQLDTAFFMAGCLVGSSPLGWLSDRFGRRKVILLGSLLLSLLTLGTALSPGFEFFIATRFLVGLLSLGIFNVTYTLGMEFVGPTQKRVPGVLLTLSFILGHVLLTGLAYWVKGWRMIQLTIALVSMASVLCCCILPESARWLILQGRAAEATAIVRKAARVNRAALPAAITLIGSPSHKHPGSEEQKRTALDLLRKPNLRRNTVVLCINWFSICCAYYGLLLNTQNLAGNLYINFLLMGLCEVPAQVGLALLLDRIKRKSLLLASQLLGGGACLAAACFAWHEMGWPTVGSCLAGQFLISSSFTCILLYTVEILPTAVRSTGVGLCNTFGRLGCIACPWVIFMADAWKPAPFVLFGTMATGASLLVLRLPETLGRKLPETLEDGEKL